MKMRMEEAKQAYDVMMEDLELYQFEASLLDKDYVGMKVDTTTANAISDGMVVGRIASLEGDNEIWPPAGEYGTIIAWSDGAKKLHGARSSEFADSLAWENLAVVEYNDNGFKYTPTFRIGFGGEFWLQEALVNAEYKAAQDGIRGVQMRIGELKSAYENTESNYNRMKAEAEWADKQFAAEAANAELRGREGQAQEVLNSS